MKLLFICPDWFPISAGLSQSCLEICKGLEELGHEIKIVVADIDGLESKGMNIIPIKHSFRMMGRNPVPFFYWKQIKEHIKWADNICLFSYMYEMNSRILIYKKLGLFNKPVIHFYRGSLEREGMQFLSYPVRIVKEIWDATLGKIMFTWSDKTISNSKPTIKYIQKKYGVSREKLAYIPTGVHLNTYTKSKLNNNRVLFIGRLIENKGVHHFEEILQVIPKNWKFTIIGNGPMDKEVLELSKTYSQLEVLGKVPYSIVKEYAGKSDLLVLPTYAEGSPRAVIDATASDVPAIVFDVGDSSSFLPKQSLIPIGNIKRFVKEVKKLITDKEERKKRVTKKSYDLSETNKLIEKELLDIN